MNAMKKRKKLTMPSLRAGCPFCWEWLPPAELLTGVFSSGSRGGQAEKVKPV